MKIIRTLFTWALVALALCWAVIALPFAAWSAWRVRRMRARMVGGWEPSQDDPFTPETAHVIEEYRGRVTCRSRTIRDGLQSVELGMGRAAQATMTGMPMRVRMAMHERMTRNAKPETRN